ncbi:DUF6984 family protein [Mesoterricola sediminis]|uniref:DUF6984 family protein n=1 Tax=Mesoterricola sediminis TaxID=2927980 RepID=UPI0029309AE0|nr:hypothetical protein [Mesoterricola sediminis]
MKCRSPRSEELALLIVLLKKGNIIVPPDWVDTLLVKEQADGGMGSLLLGPDGNFDPLRRMGRVASEVQFKDSDGVDVLASLNLDDKDNLFELNIWKVNFSPLKAWPYIDIT